jgi:ribosome-associated protein
MPGDVGGQRADRRLSGGNRIPAAEIVELASRSSGPGGQHVNTSSTRVSLRWNIRESEGLTEQARERLLTSLRPRLSRRGVLIVHADRSRSRQRNLEAAYERLYELVESALYEAAPRKPTAPTRGSKQRRLEAKRQRGDVKTQRRVPRDHEG